MKKLLLPLLLLSCGSLHAYTRIATNQAADVVLGQSSFTASALGTTATGMNNPRAIAVDPTTGKVYVADYQNNRVLRFSSTAALAKGAAAERVIGQPNLTTTTGSSATQTNLLQPTGLAFDDAGRLYVADTGHHRVLRYNAPSAAVTDGIAASGVLGQPDFTTGNSTIAAAGMFAPTAVAVQASGGNILLWVADSSNHRVTLFVNPQSLANGAAASKVLGQTNLTTRNNPMPPTASSMNSPEGLAIAADGILWVADTDNHRLLRFDAVGSSITNGRAADFVLGQTDFTSGDVPSAVTAANLYRPQGIALDASGTTTSLWVVDRVRNRVLRFDDANGALTNGAKAKVVLGQSSFSGELAHTTQRGFEFPYGITVDNSDTTASPRTVWVADTLNNRVMRFNPHLPNKPTLGGGSSYKTKKKRIKIAGSASAEAGVASVKFQAPKSGFQAAIGTTSWFFTGKLKVGTNRFTVIAYDKLGQASAAKVIVVKRKKK
ncbi:MAG TPA: NHL repeat-containing protein [Chthoniobacterales bacterium]